MDGALPNSRKRHEEIIRIWMETIIKDGGIERYDDLHVDQIDRAWKARARWIEAALESFEIAVGLRNNGKSKLSVVLAFSLESDEFPKGLDFTNLEGLEKNFHATPPSLYLFLAGTEFWTRVAGKLAADIVKEVDAISLFGPNLLIKRCVYMELKRPDDNEYRRSLFIAG